MKEITLKVCEIAVDGLPKESHENVLVFYGNSNSIVPYSSKYKAFNSHDYMTYTDEQIEHARKFWSDVTHYAAIPSLKTITEGR